MENQNEKFPTVGVDFTDEEINESIVIALEKGKLGFDEASVYRFKEELDKGTSFEESCRILLFNEVCIRAIANMTAKAENSVKQSAQGDSN